MNDWMKVTFVVYVDHIDYHNLLLEAGKQIKANNFEYEILIPCYNTMYYMYMRVAIFIILEQEIGGRGLR